MMENEENTEVIKARLISLGIEEWKINLILPISNSYQQALDFISDADWDSIDFVSTENAVQLSNPENLAIPIINKPELGTNDTERIKNIWKMISDIGPESRKEWRKELMKDIEDANKIFFKCLEMGFDNINSRFAAEFFDSFESAAEYLTEWAKLDELGKIKSQIYYTAKEMGKDEATARKAGINFDSLEEAIKFLSIEEETKQDENFVINQPPEENENSKIIYEICQEMGLSEEKSILVAHSCTDIEDAIEFATTIKNEETFVLNTQDFNIPSQARIDKEKERLISGNFEGYFGNKLIKSNEEGLFYIYDPCQNELIGEEETKEDIQIEICLAEIENKLNGANIPAGRSAEEFNAEEVLNEEIKENNEERWISSESMSIDGIYVEGTNRERIMDILSDIIPIAGLSEEAKSRIIEFLYDGEIICKECVICREKFEEKDVLYKLPCSHIFHKDCFLKYAERNENCPLDRQKI